MIANIRMTAQATDAKESSGCPKKNRLLTPAVLDYVQKRF
jgi:hypothetical protein